MMTLPYSWKDMVRRRDLWRTYEASSSDESGTHLAEIETWDIYESGAEGLEDKPGEDADG